MKIIVGFLAGVASTAAISAAAQCIQEDDLTPMVKIIDAQNKQPLVQCKVAIAMPDSHQILCDRRL